MSERILRRREVEACVGLARSTIYEMVFRGDFPAPIKLGARAVGWIEAEIAQWLEGRKAHRPRTLAEYETTASIAPQAEIKHPAARIMTGKR